MSYLLHHSTYDDLLCNIGMVSVISLCSCYIIPLPIRHIVPLPISYIIPLDISYMLHRFDLNFITSVTTIRRAISRKDI